MTYTIRPIVPDSLPYAEGLTTMEARPSIPNEPKAYSKCNPKSCINCAYHTSTFYNGKPLPLISACTHLAFCKSGIGRVVNPKPYSIIKDFSDQRNKPSPEIVRSLISPDNPYNDTVPESSGSPMKYWAEIIDILLPYRVCESYSHPLYYLPLLLNEKSPHIKPEHLHTKLPLFTEFLAHLSDPVGSSAFPLYAQFHEKHHFVNMFQEVTYEPLDQYIHYHQCKTCQYFSPASTSFGAPLPLKGWCSLHCTSAHSGLFSLTESSSSPEPTLSFLSCDHHQFKALYHPTPKDIVYSLPPKLVVFIETNQPQPSLEYMQECCYLPRAFKQPLMEQEEFTTLLTMNQDDNMLRKFNNNDHIRFDKDFALSPVKDFFVRQVKRYGKQHDDFFRRYEHLMD